MTLETRSKAASPMGFGSPSVCPGFQNMATLDADLLDGDGQGPTGSYNTLTPGPTRPASHYLERPNKAPLFQRPIFSSTTRVQAIMGSQAFRYLLAYVPESGAIGFGSAVLMAANLKIGGALLTLPYVVAQGGLAASAVILILATVVMLLTSQWYTEIQGRLNALVTILTTPPLPGHDRAVELLQDFFRSRQTNSSEGKALRSHLVPLKYHHNIVNVFEANEICSLLFGRVGQRMWELQLTLLLTVISWLGVVMMASTLSSMYDIIPEPGCKTDCQTYKVYVGLLFVVFLPFCLVNVGRIFVLFQWFCTVMLAVSLVAYVSMVGFIEHQHGNPRSGAGQVLQNQSTPIPSDCDVEWVFKGEHIFATVAALSVTQVGHFGLPSLIAVVKDRATFNTMINASSILYYDHETWATAMKYFLLLIPLWSVAPNLPLAVVSLGSNIAKALPTTFWARLLSLFSFQDETKGSVLDGVPRGSLFQETDCGGLSDPLSESGSFYNTATDFQPDPAMHVSADPLSRPKSLSEDDLPGRTYSHHNSLPCLTPKSHPHRFLTAPYMPSAQEGFVVCPVIG
eukprot:gene5390-133_t